MTEFLPTQITDILKAEPNDTPITVYGWIKSKRESKGGFSFIALHDGSCAETLQLVADNTLDNYDSEIAKLSTGCSIEATGQLVASQGGKQAVELQVSTLKVLGWIKNPETYPIAKKRHSFEVLRKVAHLRPRTNTFNAMTRIRHQLANAIHNYFHQQGFYWVNTPILTGSDCEGAGELFRVSTLDLLNLPKQQNGHINFQEDFFGQEAYLTVSGQLQVESFCQALSRVYTFGPTFRAENSNTSRHLAEFWMVEPEVAFADLDQIAQLAEHFLRSVVTTLLDTCETDLGFFNQWVDKTCLERLEQVANTSFEHMNYTNAISLLEKSKQSFEFPVSWGIDLQSEHERYIAEQHVKGPVIIKNYPKDIKAFYMRANDDGKTCAAMDVLAPGIGEIIGGSQREERADVLQPKMAAHGLEDTLDWYLQLREYGTMPHGGFGLGFERFLNYITGMDNIRDAIPFPRAPGLIEF